LPIIGNLPKVLTKTEIKLVLQGIWDNSQEWVTGSTRLLKTSPRD